jgi:hypothetical protein
MQPLTSIASGAVQKTPQIGITQQNADQKFKVRHHTGQQSTQASSLGGGKEITVKAREMDKPTTKVSGHTGEHQKKESEAGLQRLG